MDIKKTFAYKILQKMWRKFKKDCLEWYWRRVPAKWEKVRKKDKIKVLFVVFEEAQWKSEALYVKMLAHPRFNPILAVAASKEYDKRTVKEKMRCLKRYIESKGYDYVTVRGFDIRFKIRPDIIFYSKPYDPCVDWRVYWPGNLYALFCFVNYGFHNKCHEFHYTRNLHKYSSQFYVENESVRSLAVTKAGIDRGSFMITGLPLTDDFLTPPLTDPWKPQSISKKRIIYAPHWTVDEDGFTTFMNFADFIQELAVKYQEKTQWTFKPHPQLRQQLDRLWGKERTDKYYERWATMDNTQYVDGTYMDLFKQSDAMIHDCCSFTIEYLHMQKPVLYLVKPGRESDGTTNQQWQAAFNQHYKARNEEDIEDFIKNVIDGVDPMKEQRAAFFNEYLLPPNGKTACENIIEAILGK